MFTFVIGTSTHQHISTLRTHALSEEVKSTKSTIYKSTSTLHTSIYTSPRHSQPQALAPYTRTHATGREKAPYSPYNGILDTSTEDGT